MISPIRGGGSEVRKECAQIAPVHDDWEQQVEVRRDGFTRTVVFRTDSQAQIVTF